MIPSVKGGILLNAQRRTIKLKVTSLCDRPIQVCLAIFCSLVNLEANHGKLTIGSCDICIVICLRCSREQLQLPKYLKPLLGTVHFSTQMKCLKCICCEIFFAYFKYFFHRMNFWNLHVVSTWYFVTFQPLGRKSLSFP